MILSLTFSLIIQLIIIIIINFSIKSSESVLNFFFNKLNCFKKMIINIEKQSIKLIKPSVQTPLTLRHYKIGFIDELVPSMNVSVVLFFSANRDHDPKMLVNRLEQSLETSLTRLYPLAGRYVNETHTIDCGDEGVEFTHAKVEIKMQDIDFATQENVKFVDDFIPSKLRDGDPLLAVQITVFGCGGVALGVRANHRIVDASTLCAFVNDWAATSREESDDREFTGPGFNSSSLFPSRSFRPLPGRSISDDDMSSKYTRMVFKFDESAISNMKEKAVAGENISTCNRRFSKVQLVSAIIWKTLIDIDRANNNPRESIFIQTINLREKTLSLIPKHSCGNLWGFCTTKSGIVETTTEELADRLTDSVKKTITDFSKVNHNTEEGQLTVLNSFSMPNIRKSTNVISLTSWCKFPFYGADFGFGNPSWAAPGRVPIINTPCLMDDAGGSGVDAHILVDVKNVRYIKEALQVYSFST